MARYVATVPQVLQQIAAGPQALRSPPSSPGVARQLGQGQVPAREPD